MASRIYYTSDMDNTIIRHRRYGLIGNPVSASLSPRLFDAGYGGRYIYDLIEDPDFHVLYNRFKDSYDAVNVTAPFKGDAFEAAALHSEICLKIGAANILQKTPAGIKAGNSDYSGVILSLSDELLPEKGYGFFTADNHSDDIGNRSFPELPERIRDIYKRTPAALIIGCGGAGRAAAVAAADMGYRVILANRTGLKAVRLAEELGKNMKSGDIMAAATEDIAEAAGEADIIIYTVPGPADISRLAGNSRWLAGKILLEAEYRTPSFSGAVLEDLVGKGLRYISGRRWLLYQAFACYSSFTGEIPDFNKMQGILI